MRIHRHFFHLLGDETFSLPRTQRILNHYAREITQGHMTYADAVDRAKGDLSGQNRHPDKEQR